MSRFGFYPETGTAYYRKSINLIIDSKRKKKENNTVVPVDRRAQRGSSACARDLPGDLLPPATASRKVRTSRRRARCGHRGGRARTRREPGRGAQQRHLPPGLPGGQRVLAEAHAAGTRQHRARKTSRGIACVTLTQVPGLLGLAIGPWRPPFSVGVHRGRGSVLGFPRTRLLASAHAQARGRRRQPLPVTLLPPQEASVRSPHRHTCSC